MSLPQAAENSLSYASFLARMARGDLEQVSWGPVFSGGTRVFAMQAGVWRAFLINDLLPGTVTIAGQPVSVTVSNAPIVTSVVQPVKTGLGSVSSTSLSSGGAAAGPLAGTNISGSIVLVAGNSYNLWAWATVDLGAVVAADLANMVLVSGATNVMTLPYTSKAGGPFGPFRITGAGQTVHVDTVANGTGGVVYAAGVHALQVA